MSSYRRDRNSYNPSESNIYPYDAPPDYGFIHNQNNNKVGTRNHRGQTHPPEAPPTYSVLQVRFVTSLIITLYVTGSSTSSLIPQYLLDRWTTEAGHNRTHSNESVCDRNESDARIKIEDEIQARVSIATMYYNYATCGPAILASVIFGALVDMVGRRPAVICSLVGYNLKVIIVVLIVRFDLNTNFFYLAFALDGISGGFFTNLLAMFSITADINSHKGNRILWIAILTAIGSVTGAATSIGLGYLIQDISYFSASMTLMGPLGLSLLCSIFFLPETLPPSMKQTLSLRNMGEYTSRMYYLYLHDGSKRKRWALFISLMIFFTSVLNFITLGATDTLYQRHQPFCWDPTKIGFYGAFRSFAQAIPALIYLKIHQWIGCARDEIMSMIGMLFMAASFVLEAFVKDTWQMYMGVLFSSIAVIEALCNMASATTYNKVYAATVDFMPGIVYFVMAGVAIITFLLYIPFFYCYEQPPKAYERLVNPDEDDSHKYDAIA